MPLLFVNGTLMKGLALHENLATAVHLQDISTAPTYRLHSIDDVHPGMFREEIDGASIAGELYDVPASVLHRVVAREPPDLYVDDVELSDGRVVLGVLYPRDKALRHPDITPYGGWRPYIQSRSSDASQPSP